MSPKISFRRGKERREVHFYESVTEKHQFFFGIGIKTFKWILDRIKPHVIRYHLQLTFADHLLLALMKIRLSLLNGDLAVRLKIHRPREWVQVLSNVLSSLEVQ